jgi:hypothetical protein
MRKSIGLIFIHCLVFASVWAQEVEDFEISTDSIVDLSRPKIPFFLELGISANAYNGDLSTYQKWSACYHAGLKFNRNRLINSRLGFSFGFITGDNRFYEFSGGNPNNFFRSSLFSVDYEMQINLYRKSNFQVYTNIGLSLFRFQVKNEEGQNLFDILDSRAENEVFANNVIAFPIGLGATYILKNGYGLGCQASLLNTQTDYLDNISLWGTKAGNDNVLRFKFYIYAPLKFVPSKLLVSPARRKREYTHF